MEKPCDSAFLVSPSILGNCDFKGQVQFKAFTITVDTTCVLASVRGLLGLGQNVLLSRSVLIWGKKIFINVFPNTLKCYKIVCDELETILAYYIFLDSKITADGDCGHEIKRCLLLERKAMTHLDRQHIKNQKHYFVNKGPHSQIYGFSSPHVWMWELDHKAEYWRIDAFEKTLESPLNCKEIESVSSKGNQS